MAPDQEPEQSPDLDPAKIREVVTERLEIDTQQYPDPLIDTKEIAVLAGVRPGTVVQWIQRTRRGELAEPFPPRDPESSRWGDKPLWRAVSQVVPWLVETQKWPPGTAARPYTRGPRTRQPRRSAA